MKKLMWIVVAAMFVVTVGGAFMGASAAEIERITKEELKEKLDAGQANLVIGDVRRGSDWKGSEFKIKDAVRVDSNDLDAFAEEYDRDDEIVLYCA